MSATDDRVMEFVDGAAWLAGREELTARPTAAGGVSVVFPTASDAVTGPLLAAVEASPIDTVQARCQCGRPLAHVQSDTDRRPELTVLVVYRTEPDLLHQSDLARYARRRYPDQNPKAPDVTVGLCWLVGDAPAAITTRCPKCKTVQTVDRNHLVRAHLRDSTDTITTTSTAPG